MTKMIEALRKLQITIDNRILKNILWLSFDKIFKLLLGLFAGVWMARYLGPHSWGKLNYVNAFLSITLSVTTLGMDGFLIKEIVEKSNKKNDVLGTSFIMRLWAVLLLFVVDIVILYLLKSDEQIYRLFFFLFLTVVLTPFDLIDIEYQSELKSRKTILAKNSGYVIGAVLKISAILMRLDLIYFAAISGIEAVLAYFILIGQYQNTGNSIFNWKFNKQLVSHFIAAGWPFVLSGLAIILYMRLDQIMLENLSTAENVGEFSAAVKVSEMFLFIPAAIGGSYYPMLLEAKQNLPQALYYAKVRQLLLAMVTLSFVICIPVALCSDFIIRLLYGSHYSGASPVLRIYIWSLIAIFFGVITSQYLVMESLQKFNFYRTVAGLLLNIALNLLLIPQYGSAGAAFATLASQYMSSVISNLFFGKTRQSLGKLIAVQNFNS